MVYLKYRCDLCDKYYRKHSLTFYYGSYLCRRCMARLSSKLGTRIPKHFLLKTSLKKYKSLNID